MEPFFVFSFILILSLLLPTLSLSSNDTDALTQFRLHSDSHGNLSGNWTTSAGARDACAAAWLGVHCIDGRVAALSLPSLDLRGPLDPLARLDQLRILDLHGNRLNGTLLPVANCSNLKLLYLAGNDFSGEIPSELGSLRRLRRLDLSNNNLRGSIPSSLVSGLTRLLTLYLENNVLSGSIPNFANSSILQLNLSNNQLHGHLPETLIQKFGNQSFLGNQDLCGSTPLPNCSSTVDLATPPAESTADSTVPSNPSSLPTSPLTYSDKKEPRKGLSPGAIAAIVIGNSVLLLVLVSFAVAYCCGKYSRESNYSSKVGTEEGKRRSGSSYGNEKKAYDSDGTNATDRSKLVFYDRTKQFELEDLLRASAEMLGKGSFGTVYRAVLDNGATVAVKRLKDANPCVRKDFEQYMDVIGKMKHPNIVRLRAYYYAKEEKLLVYDYLPNGSLHSLLHSNRGPGRIPLDWTTRISLVLGAARGLARIHQEYNSPKIPHGNVKSSNILLDKNGVACISDFGLSLLLNPIHATARLGGYRAPEQAETKRLSQKADVYGFGVLVLELLTGREPLQHASPMRPRTEEEGEGLDLPKWVRSVVRDEWTSEVFDEELLRYKNIEEELVAMLQVGLACVVPQPERRPTMSEVAKMIEEIRVEQSPLGEDCDESRNSLSPSLATTEDGLGAY